MDTNKTTDTSINLATEAHSREKSWWNRPLWGEDSLLEAMMGKLSKPEVSESVIFLHNRELMDARVFAKTAEAIDHDKFSNQEFLLFIKIKYLLAKGMEEYEGLYHSTRLLQVAIKAKNSFLTIDQTELRYRGSKQQQFYEFVEALLHQDLSDKIAFREHIQNKLAELLPQVKTEEGKIALQAYAKELDTLSEDELGLKLLSLFKAYQLTDYSILRTISNLVDRLGESDLQDFKGLVALVMVNYEVFDKLSKIIGVSEKLRKPDTYARMIQYIALTNRHQLSFVKFNELMRVMRKWYRPYQAIVGIRQEHPSSEYKQPQDFCQEIPGLNVYLKYKNWLTDKKTGHTYIDFGEEVHSATS